MKVVWLDGQTRVYTLTSAQPTVQLYGSADDRRGRGEIARAYTVLGVEHILSGIDHLLFVAGLLFLVGFQRRLIGTITAFTLAHSLTLACSVFGWITLRSPPVEATHRDVDRAGRQRGPARARHAGAAPAGAGVVPVRAGARPRLRRRAEGASACRRATCRSRCSCFNVGVELGQLLVVLVAFAVVRLPVSQRWLGRARRPALYAIGTLAAYWSWLRIAAIAF